MGAVPEGPPGDLPVLRRFAHELLILAPGERRDTLLEAIRSARKSIALSLFRCDDSKVLDEIAEALERGVQVKALVTQKAKGWERRLQNLRVFLESMGAKVYRYSGDKAKYHAKYAVIDEAVALVTSLNFTHKCFRDTCDFLVVTPDSGVARSLATLFQSDCTAPETVPKDLHPRLIVGPEHARRRIEQLFSGALSRIRIIDHRIADPGMAGVLRDRASAGVAVEVLGKGQIPGLRSHGKMMSVDGRVAAIGSISLSPPSLNKRREVSLLLEDPELVARLETFFHEKYEARLPGDGGFQASADDFDDEEDEDEEDDGE